MFSPDAVSNRAPARSGPPRKHLLAPLGPSSRAPMRGVGRSFLGGLVDDLCDRLWLEDGRPAGARRVIQPLGPVLQKTLFPAPHGLPHDPQLLGNLLLRLTGCQPQDDFRPLHRSRRNRAAAGATLEFVLLWLGQLDLGGGWHGVRDGDGTLAPLHHTVPYSRANVQRNPGSKSAPLAAVCMVQNF